MFQTYKPRLAALMVVAATFTACDDDDGRASLRAKIDYNSLTAETPYTQPFVDANGQSTVDLSPGNLRYKMFQALNYYGTSSVSANTAIDATKLKNMFANSGNPFSDISTSTITVTGQTLNDADFSMQEIVASSLPAAEAADVRADFETWFNELAAASASVNATASRGQAGKLGTYLVDGRGIEPIQVIQKGLIGAMQLDFIGNVLLDEGLNADNYELSGDGNFTELEHNWDIAYGLLTLNPIYLQGATDANRSTVEFGAGAYIWEYNKASYAKIHPAFLKGRAAIVNNDRAEFQTQAQFIRTEFEKAIASAALGYLDKWKTGTTDAARAHAIGEGIGFIYSLRFATIHGGSATYSDNILINLVGSTGGFWDLDVAKINAAAQEIKTKFNL